MDEVQIPIDSECYKTSELFRINLQEARLLTSKVWSSPCAVSVDRFILFLLNIRIFILYCAIILPVLSFWWHYTQAGLTSPTKKPKLVSGNAIKYLTERSWNKVNIERIYVSSGIEWSLLIYCFESNLTRSIVGYVPTTMLLLLVYRTTVTQLFSSYSIIKFWMK
jgi:hypothetical protein